MLRVTRRTIFVDSDSDASDASISNVRQIERPIIRPPEPVNPDRVSTDLVTATAEERNQAETVEAIPQVVRNYLTARPTVTLVAVRPDEAQEMEDAVGGVVNAGRLEVWAFNSKKSLVAYTDSLDHWNAIAAISRIDVLTEQRHFPLVSSQGRPSYAAVPQAHGAIARSFRTILASKVVLAIAAVVVGTTAVWVFKLFDYEPFGDDSISPPQSYYERRLTHCLAIVFFLNSVERQSVGPIAKILHRLSTWAVDLLASYLEHMRGKLLNLPQGSVGYLPVFVSRS